MRLKPKTYIYIFYSLLAAVLLSLIFINTLFFAGEPGARSGTQVLEPAGGSLVDQLRPVQRFMHNSQ